MNVVHYDQYCDCATYCKLNILINAIMIEKDCLHIDATMYMALDSGSSDSRISGQNKRQMTFNIY